MSLGVINGDYSGQWRASSMELWHTEPEQVSATCVRRETLLECRGPRVTYTQVACYCLPRSLMPATARVDSTI